MKIGLDFDGVIADYAKTKAEVAKLLFGIDIRPEETKKEIAVPKHMTLLQFRAIQMVANGIKEVAMSTQFVPGAQHWINHLLRERHKLKVVTSRSGIARDLAELWLPWKEILVIGVGHDVSKAEAAAGCDVFVDDDLDKLEELVGVVPHRFLFTWKHNEGMETGEIAKRISSWKELHEQIMRLDKEARI